MNTEIGKFPPIKRRIKWAGSSLALFVVLASSACSSGERARGARESASPPEPDDGGYAFTLPISRYSYSSAEVRLMEAARGKITQECMKSLGLHYEIPAESTSESTISDRRYGLSSSIEAARYGYHLPAQRLKQRESYSQEIGMALTGEVQKGVHSSPVGEVNGAKIPQGGCLGESERELPFSSSASRGAEIARAVDVSSFQESEKSHEVLGSFKSWSTCMKNRGYLYTSPLKALEDKRFMRSEPHELEVATAVADVECKKKGNVLATWFSVEVKIQERMIKNHLKELGELHDMHVMQISRAKHILSHGETR